MTNNFLSSAEILDSLSEIGVKKAKNVFTKTVILGTLAGVYIGLGAHFCTNSITGLEVGFGLTKLIGGVTFSIGLILVLIAGAELFTGNNLLSIAYFDKKINLKKLLKNWTIVYFANFFGALLLVVVIFFAGLNGLNGDLSKVGETALKIAEAKVSLSFIQIFFRAILANLLVCLAVYLAVGAKDISGKILGIVFPVTAFVAMGFEHSIANMYFLSMGYLLKGAESAITFQSIANNLTAATIGNIIGGAIFVGVVYWFVHRK